MFLEGAGYSRTKQKKLLQRLSCPHPQPQCVLLIHSITATSLLLPFSVVVCQLMKRTNRLVNVQNKDFSYFVEWIPNKEGYLSLLAVQAERYDEMVLHLQHEETMKGNEEQAKFAAEYCRMVAGELQQICDTILGLLVPASLTRTKVDKLQDELTVEELKLLSEHLCKSHVRPNMLHSMTIALLLPPFFVVACQLRKWTNRFLMRKTRILHTLLNGFKSKHPLVMYESHV